MKILGLVVGLLACFTASAQYRRGVNVSGAEFGMSNLPGVFGRDYTFQSENTFRYFGDKGLGLIRFPLQWERLQPALHGPLDSAYLANTKQAISWAKAHGGDVILDVQNFGRYSMNENGSLKAYIIDNAASDGTVKVTTADLADLWTRLSSEFKFERTVYAYDLMNEPHDMGSASWKSISQTVLSAIRANQDEKLILVPGDSWSSGNRWMATHGPTAWIKDPMDNFAYEAHVYFDSDESGSYKSTYDAELARNADLAHVGSTRVSHFIDWCRANSVRGIVDEYGIPGNDPRWLTVLDKFLAAIDAAGMDGAYWAAGEWWGNYALSVQPTANFTVDRPQMPTLLAHAPGGFLTALSSASLSVARATPGSLATVFGSGFTDQTASGAAPYPPGLADVTVNVTDSAGSIATAPLLYVSPSQVNLQIPNTFAAGRAKITIMRAGLAVASGSVLIAPAAPALFTANGQGFGTPAAWAVRVKADGTQSYEAITDAPIALGPPTDRVFLLLYGTGVTGPAPSMTIGAMDVPVTYAGPQGQYPGLDQINAELPRGVAGAGLVDVMLKIGGEMANVVTIAVK